MTDEKKNDYKPKAKADEELTDLERQQIANQAQLDASHKTLDQDDGTALKPHQRPLESGVMGTVGPGRAAYPHHPTGDGLIGDDWQANPPGVAVGEHAAHADKDPHTQRQPPVDPNAAAAGDGIVGKTGELSPVGPGAAIPGASGRVIGGGARPNRAFHESAAGQRAPQDRRKTGDPA